MINKLSVIINTQREDSLKEFKPALNVYKCPKCGSYHIVRNGTYTRKTTVIKEESIIITVQKYLCRKCGISFKELPFHLSSLNHLSVISLLKIVLNEDSINKVSKMFEISRNTIRNIRNKYNYERHRIKVLANKYVIESVDHLLNLYKHEFNKYLFEPSTSKDTSIPYVIRIS